MAEFKGILIVADGLGGRPTDTPEGKTCLEAARTPHLDGLARRGALGLLDPIAPGVRPGSDTAHLSLFGYDPFKEYPGRGVFEAVGVGLEVHEGDICFRTNFATVDENFVVTDRRAGRLHEGQEELEKALQGLKPRSAPDVEVVFKASTEHRGALVLRGPDLSPAVSEADPHEVGRRVHEVVPLEDTPEARRTAQVVNDILKQSYEILKDLPLNKEREAKGLPPANILLPRGPSTVPRFETLPRRYGIEGAVIAAGALYIGIGKLLGLEFKQAKGATGGLDTNIRNKIALALEELKTKDFVFVHVKGTDTAGHDRATRRPRPSSSRRSTTPWERWWRASTGIAPISRSRGIMRRPLSTAITPRTRCPWSSWARTSCPMGWRRSASGRPNGGVCSASRAGSSRCWRATTTGCGSSEPNP